MILHLSQNPWTHELASYSNELAPDLNWNNVSPLPPSRDQIFPSDPDSPHTCQVYGLSILSNITLSFHHRWPTCRWNVCPLYDLESSFILFYKRLCSRLWPQPCCITINRTLCAGEDTAERVSCLNRPALPTTTVWFILWIICIRYTCMLVQRKQNLWKVNEGECVRHTLHLFLQGLFVRIT